MVPPSNYIDLSLDDSPLPLPRRIRTPPVPRQRPKVNIKSAEVIVLSSDEGPTEGDLWPSSSAKRRRMEVERPTLAVVGAERVPTPDWRSSGDIWPGRAAGAVDGLGHEAEEWPTLDFPESVSRSPKCKKPTAAMANKSTGPIEGIINDEEDWPSLDLLEDRVVKSKPATSATTVPKRRTEKRDRSVDVFNDPVRLSSSPLEPVRARNEEPRRKVSTGGAFERISWDELRSPPRPAKEPPRSTTGPSSRRFSRGMLSESSDNDRGFVVQKSSFRALHDLEDDENLWETQEPEEVVPAKTRRPKSKLTQTEKDERERQKQQEKAKKEREKEVGRERKEREREAERERKQKEKEALIRRKQVEKDLKDANRNKTDKKIATPEMIVDLPSSLNETVLGEHIDRFLAEHEISSAKYDSRFGTVIKWRRNTTTQWNEDEGLWTKIAAVITEEKHLMCHITAQEFVDLARSSSEDDAAEEGDVDVDSHVSRLKSVSEDCILIYLIEGLEAWMRKNKNLRNRALQAAVLDQDNEEALAPDDQQQSRRRRKKAVPLPVDEDTIEDALLRLQVLHGCLVHHTSSAVETAEWVVKFTQHVATAPYKAQRMNIESAFCMDAGQVRTGYNAEETYSRMLQEIVRVTPSIAWGIIAEYPDVQRLVAALKAGGPTTLEDVRKTSNRNGAFADGRIGTRMSKRIYKIFVGLDPESYDV